MDTSNHYCLQTLFQQLGLGSKPEQIGAFIKTHRLKQNEKIQNADFWNSAQAAFIQECILEDSEWVELVDHLDALLR